VLPQNPGSAKEQEMTKASPRWLKFTLLLTVLCGLAVAQSETRVSSKQRPTLFIALDTTGSTASFHEQYISFAKRVLMLIKDRNIPAMLARTCGITELVADSPNFTRKDFDSFGKAMTDSLASCSPNSTQVIVDREGSNLGSAIKVFEKLPDNTIGLLITDGLNFPAPQQAFIDRLRALPANRRANLFVAGVDEGVFLDLKLILPKTTCRDTSLSTCYQALKQRLK
jgi:hypothetical protein